METPDQLHPNFNNLELHVLEEKLRTYKQDRENIRAKIKDKNDYVSRIQLLVFRRQLYTVNRFIEKVQLKIDLHPDNKTMNKY